MLLTTAETFTKSPLSHDRGVRDGYNKIFSSLISVFNAILPFLQLAVELTFMQIAPSFDELNLTVNIRFRFEIRLVKKI